MKALVVDDKINNRKLLSKMLGSRGYEVIEAGNGMEALEQVKKETPDIIISDIMMPVMDGFTLLRRLGENSKTKAIPFIFYTAVYVSEEDKQLGLSLGALRFLVKPIELKDFFGELEAALEEVGAGKLKPSKTTINDKEYLTKYSERVFLKLESKIKELEEEVEKRIKAEQALEVYIEKQAVLVELSWLVINDADIPDLMNHVVGLTGKTLNTEYSTIYEFLPDHSKLVLRAGTGWKKELIGSATVETGEKSHAGFTLHSNEPVVLEDADTEERFKLSPLLKDHGIKSGMTVIITGRERPFGILGVHTTQLRRFTADDVIYIQNVANTLSLAIERRRAEDELRESEENYRNLYEEAPNAYFSVGTDGKIIKANRRAGEMLGFTRPELIGKPVPELHADTPSGKAKAKEIFKTLITGKEIRGEELEMQRKDGSRVWVALSVRPVKDESGKVIASRSIAVDITERKLAEEIRVEKERLEYASKAKSDFLASMSHELRTPLNAVLGFAELLKIEGECKLSEKQKRYVDNIQTSGNFLLNLINDILDLSKVEAGKIELKKEKLSIPITIDETITLIKEKAIKHNIIIKKEIDPGLDCIEADRQRVKQILFNLLSNAVKFSKEEGGTVTITAKKVGEIMQVSVSDTGIGIKPENMERLFQKFEQLEKGISARYGGTGLGLSICKQLSEQHGGKIWAESKYGEGSTFTFTLPVVGKV
jgi:PAS domain S-box-containing protein